MSGHLDTTSFARVCRFGKLALTTLGSEFLVTYKGHIPLWPLSLLFRLLTGLAIFSDNKREAQSVCISPTAADDDVFGRWGTLLYWSPSIAKRPWVGAAADECLPSDAIYCHALAITYCTTYCSSRYWKYVWQIDDSCGHFSAIGKLAPVRQMQP